MWATIIFFYRIKCNIVKSKIRMTFADIFLPALDKLFKFNVLHHLTMLNDTILYPYNENTTTKWVIYSDWRISSRIVLCEIWNCRKKKQKQKTRQKSFLFWTSQ